jgi:hypothetical protein
MGDWSGETVGPDVWETCRELIPAGSVFAFLAEHRGALFPAGMFADMYPSRNGRPSMPPQILAAAITLQALHGLSDIDTVQELRCDLRWKAACGLGLHDTAFDSSLLAYFRRRLARSARPNRVFEAVREVVHATGVLSRRRGGAAGRHAGWSGAGPGRGACIECVVVNRSVFVGAMRVTGRTLVLSAGCA